MTISGTTRGEGAVFPWLLRDLEKENYEAKSVANVKILDKLYSLNPAVHVLKDRMRRMESVLMVLYSSLIEISRGAP